MIILDSTVLLKLIDWTLTGSITLGQNGPVQQYSFVFTQLNGFKYSKWLNSSIGSIPMLSGPESNGQEVLHKCAV